MKCKKCAGDLPYGTYGKVKCEYCGTVNNVLTPEQERGEKIETEKRNQNIGTILIVALLVVGIIVVVKSIGGDSGGGNDYYSPNVISTTRPPITTSTPTFTPSPTTRPPATTPTPTTTTPPDCKWVDPYYDIDWGAWGTGTYENIDVIITNEEDQRITVTLTIGFFVGGSFLSDGLELERKTKSITLGPNERKYVNLQWGIERNVYFNKNAIIIDERADRIEKCT